MLSIQRRLERYRIIYCWKILEDQVPNCGISKITDSENSRQGRRLSVPNTTGKTSVCKMREQSFLLNGPKLFNCLPPKIRNMSGVGLDEFKSSLDKYLETIPDQPKMDGLVPGATHQGQYSNSIIDQSPRTT